MFGAIAIRTFMAPGIALIVVSALLIVVAQRRHWPLWMDVVAGFSFVAGLSSLWVSMSTVSDGPQEFTSFQDAFSSFYGNSWLYVAAFGLGAAVVLIAVAAVLRRARPTASEILAIAVGCLAGAAVVGLLDTSISPF